MNISMIMLTNDDEYDHDDNDDDDNVGEVLRDQHLLVE